jgi:hypothetical protein
MVPHPDVVLRMILEAAQSAGLIALGRCRRLVGDGRYRS